MGYDTKEKTKRHISEDGFSLVEMAAVMLIIGLLMVPIFQGLSVSQKTAEQNAMEEAINNISDSLSLYLASTPGHIYPCPADPTLAPGAAGYGFEDCAAAWAGGSVASAHDIDGGAGNDRVLIGAVPFNTINNFFALNNFERFIPGGQTIDPYGMKFTYAVSQSITAGSPVPPNPNYGVVRINVAGLDGAGAITRRPLIQLIPDGCGLGTCINDVTAPFNEVDTGYYHAIVLSHGEDRKGAWDELGGARNPCPAGTGEDIENCDADGQFVASAPNLAAGAIYYDDMVAGKVWEFSSIWDSPLGAGNTGSLINTNTGNVGIGTTTPSERLDVAGTVQGAQIRGTALCFDADGPGGLAPVCFDPSRIVGPSGTDGMLCAGADEVMTGIIDGDAECVGTGLPIGTVSGVCADPSEIMTGIDSDGNLICAVP